MSSLTRQSIKLRTSLRTRQGTTLKRFNSTSPVDKLKLPGNANQSHVLAGLGGGALVLLAGYGYYHYSGAASVVSTAHSTISSAKSAKDSLMSATPSASDALSLLRTAAQSYASSIPGAKQAIDSTFDQLDSLSEKYGDQISSVLKESFTELKDAVGDGSDLKDGGEKVIKTGVKLMERIRDAVEQKGGDILDSLLEKHPELKDSVGGSLNDLKKLGDKYGPEAQQLLTSTYTDLASLLTSSKSLTSPDTISKAKELLDKKTKEFKSLASKSSNEAWEKASEQAAPLWKKVPDLKGEVEDKLKDLGGWVGEERVEVIKSLYSQLAEVSKSGKSTKEMSAEAKKIIEKQFGSLDELKDKATDFASSQGVDSSHAIKYLSAIPGVGGLASMLGSSDLKHLKELAEKHGAEGEKLLEGTYDEIKQLLKKKMQEAQKVLGDAKKDTTNSKDSKSNDKKDSKDSKKDESKDKKSSSSSSDKKSTADVDKAGKSTTIEDDHRAGNGQDRAISQQKGQKDGKNSGDTSDKGKAETSEKSKK